MPGWVGRAGSVIGFLLLCAFAYAPLAGADFSAPDLRTLVDARAALDARGLGGFVRGLHEVGGLEGHALPALSLLVSTALWSQGGPWSEARAWPLRLENLLLHAAAGIALGAFLRRLLLPWIGRDAARAAGLASMLLAALAPTAVGAVARVAARGDLLALALGCTAATLLLRGRQERQPAFGIAAGLLAILAGLSSDLALGLPLVLAVAEFTSARRWRSERVRWRTSFTTLVIFGACVGVQIALRAALEGRVQVFAVGTRLAQLRGPTAIAADIARSLERLGVLLLPVPVEVVGYLGYAVAGAALLVALHPALWAARSAPRLWGRLSFGWLAVVVLCEVLSPAVRVAPGDLSRTDALVGTATVAAAGVAICTTALSGARRTLLPWLVACSWMLLAHAGALAWSESTRQVSWLREDLEVARETYGRDALVIVLDPPGPVLGVDALQGELAALLEPKVTGRKDDPSPPRVRGATRAAFLALAREEELSELRREGVLLSFPRSAIGAPGEGRLAVPLPPPEPSGRTRRWQQLGRSPSDLDLEACGEQMLRVRAAADADTQHVPVALWRAEAALDLLREGELAGVWRTRGPQVETPVAVFDLSSSLAWLLGDRVRQIYPREGWGRIEEAEVLACAPSRPPPESAPALLPEGQAGEWRFRAPEGGFARDPEGRDSWAVGLLDLDTWRHVELPARVAASGDLVVPGAAAIVADWLRGGASAVAWSLEGRVDGVAVWRARGRRVAAGER